MPATAPYYSIPHGGRLSFLYSPDSLMTVVGPRRGPGDCPQTPTAGIDHAFCVALYLRQLRILGHDNGAFYHLLRELLVMA